MINWRWFKFKELSLDQLYDIMALREQVFTIEQQCSAFDFDGLDKQAVHLLGLDNNKILAYARILPTDIYAEGVVSFGRIVVAKEHRRQGLGKTMMQKIVDFIAVHYPNMPIKFSAQTYLQSFYERFGFRAVGDEYDEGGIPHIKMVG